MNNSEPGWRRKALQIILAAAMMAAFFIAFQKSPLISTLLSPPINESLKLEFTAYMSQVRGLQRLEVASVKSLETITKTSEFSVLWDLVKLPDLVVETRMPVRYVYFVDFKEPFRLDIQDGLARIQAPALRAGMPAPDVSAFEIGVKSGGFLRDKEKAIQDLKASITPLLMKRAEENKAVVREQARTELADFFKAWFDLRDGKTEIQEVQVTFADESGADVPAAP